MARLILLIFVGFMVSAEAKALHWLNCTSADGKYARVEKEVCGANPVGWFHSTNLKDAIELDEEKFDVKSKVVLLAEQTPAGQKRTVFSVPFKVSLKGNAVASGVATCGSYEDNARDFAIQKGGVNLERSNASDLFKLPSDLGGNEE